MNKDEHEGGLRQILNFGHTLGHALEAVTRYKRFLHGEAIGWGMIAATLLAVATGRLREADAIRIIRLVASIGPLPTLGQNSRLGAASQYLGGRQEGARRARLVGASRGASGKPNGESKCPWPVVSRAFAELPCDCGRGRIGIC